MKGKKIVFITRPGINVEKINGYETVIYHNQIEAMQAIKENPFLVVIDLGLHGITGYDLISIIRSNPCNYHIKIVMCSKKYNHNLIKKCFMGGADFYISIPFDMNEIKFIINDINHHYNKFDLNKSKEYNRDSQILISNELSEQGI